MCGMLSMHWLGIKWEMSQGRGCNLQISAISVLCTQTWWCADTQILVKMHCSLSSFWKVASSESGGNCKSHRYWSGRKHGLTTGRDIRNKNYTVNSHSGCRNTFLFCWLGGNLVCLFMWRRWLSLESSNKEDFLVNCFIMLNRQFPDIAIYFLELCRGN